jgi:hypothetical protein
MNRLARSVTNWRNWGIHTIRNWYKLVFEHPSNKFNHDTYACIIVLHLKIQKREKLVLGLLIFSNLIHLTYSTGSFRG